MDTGTSQQLVVCEYCDTVYRRCRLERGEVAECPRCLCELERYQWLNPAVLLALVLTAMLVFIQANVWPIVTLGLNGQHNSVTLWGMIVTMWREQAQIVSVITAATLFFFPLIKMSLLGWLLWFARLGVRAPGFARLMVLLHYVNPWTMSEVFVLGALVSIVKAHVYFEVVADPGIYAYAALTVLITLFSGVDLRDLWDLPEWGGALTTLPRAIDVGLIACHVCGLVCQNVSDDSALDGDGFDDPMACPRCGSTLRRRKNASLARTWALLIAGFLLYIPANVLPIMRTASLNDIDDNTIISGVAELWQKGSPWLAVIVFGASIVVPILKFGVLALLAASSQRHSRWALTRRAKLYRFVELIGYWSMLDVFVVSLLTGLVRFNVLSRVEPLPGVIFFGLTVVLTMLASMSFDPRLIWDGRDTDE